MIFIINHYVLACYNEILKMLKNKSIFFDIFQEMTAENMSHLLVVSHRVMLLRTIAILRNNRKISNRQTSVDTNNKLVRPRQCPEVEGITLAKVIHQQLQVKINVWKNTNLFHFYEIFACMKTSWNPINCFHEKKE